MIERRILRVALLGVAGLFLLGHSPYGQWYAYRAKHLVVVAAESRPGDGKSAEAVAGAIVARWPHLKAVSAAAGTTTDVVRLLRSGQLPVGLLPVPDALEAVEGRGRFADGPKVPLRVVAVVGGEVLVVMDGCSHRGAYQIAQALAEYPVRTRLGPREALRAPVPIEFHPGAVDYFEGKPAMP
jgi:TRAP-type uncharacterized transport system substrate-binding protein